MNTQCGNILLLHGLIGTLSNDRIGESFIGYTVHTPDLIGYGCHSQPADLNWSLDDQAAHVAAYIEANVSSAVHVVGHSVGGAVGVLLAAKFPELVYSLTSVEGNMTIDDAFWSAGIARKPLVEVDAMLDQFRSDIDSWLKSAGVLPSAWTRKVAAEWLNAQPASTIQSQARAVVLATTDNRYLEMVYTLLDSSLPVNLLAGQRSINDWHVPETVKSAANSCICVKGCGHLMMLENPTEFARCVVDPLKLLPMGGRNGSTTV